MPHLPDLPPTLTDRAAFLLQLALARAQQMGEQALGDLGLSGREYGVLALLESDRRAVQRELGAVLGLDRTTTMALVAGLEQRGLLHRRRDPANRRAYRIGLTPEGERLRRHAAKVLADCDQRFLAALDPTEQRQLTALLRRLT